MHLIHPIINLAASVSAAKDRKQRTWLHGDQPPTWKARK